MLILNAPVIEIKESKCFISALLCDGNQEKELCYVIDTKYKNMLSISLEPFLFWGVLMAVKEKKDLFINGNIPKRLLYAIRHFLLNAFTKMGLYIPTIKINEDKIIDETPYTAKGVATGLSGGIDSFYTILEHTKGELLLTHLVEFFPTATSLDLRSHTMELNQETILDEWNNKVKLELNLPIVKVYSNFTEYCTFPFEQIHTFCNLSHALLLKGGISRYLYSTGHTLNQTKLDFGDTSHYDLLIAQIVNSISFEMISYNPTVERIEKTAAIAQSKVVQKYLHVCVKREMGRGNCSCCFKCKRVMTQLDVIGRLNDFKETFDLDSYNKNRRKIWSEVLYRAKIMKDAFSQETLLHAKVYNYKRPRWLFFRVLGIGLRNQINKLKRLKKR